MTPASRLAAALAVVAERAVNTVLSADPEGRAGFAELEGRSVAVEVDGWGLCFIIWPDANGVRIEASTDESSRERSGETVQPDSRSDDLVSDVRIRGAASALLAMAASSGGDDDTLPDDLQITGDVAVAQALSRALARLDIDWEGLLARVTGDTAAHRISRTAGNAAQFARQSVERLLDQGGEYLREEAEVTARERDLERYAGEVDRLRDDAARLERKIARLESLLESHDK